MTGTWQALPPSVPGTYLVTQGTRIAIGDVVQWADGLRWKVFEIGGLYQPIASPPQGWWWLPVVLTFDSPPSGVTEWEKARDAETGGV